MDAILKALPDLLSSFGWILMIFAGAGGYLFIITKHVGKKNSYKFNFRYAQDCFNMILFGGLVVVGILGLLGYIQKG